MDPKGNTKNHVYVKINFDTYSCFIKYNLKNEQEISQIECSLNSQAFFDPFGKGYILDEKVIIDASQYIPLYYFKTQVTDLVNTSLYFKTIDRGSRMCARGEHLSLREKLYTSYSYQAVMLIEDGMAFS